jgi:hypothetical protein
MSLIFGQGKLSSAGFAMTTSVSTRTPKKVIIDLECSVCTIKGHPWCSQDPWIYYSIADYQMLWIRLDKISEIKYWAIENYPEIETYLYTVLSGKRKPTDSFGTIHHTGMTHTF